MAFLAGRRDDGRAERIFKRRASMDDYSDGELVARYRLNRELLGQVVEGFDLSPWANHTRRSHALTPETQVLVAVRFFAQGGSYTDEADIHGISKSTVHLCVTKVSEYLMSIAPDYIGFPNDRNGVQDIVAKFATVRNFPCILGAVDGTHIDIKAPPTNEHLYVNRKGNHSLNVQVVSDADLIIRDVEARWPGSSHDAFVWRQSYLYQDLENGQFAGLYLLGDSGYPCRPYLLTPLLTPHTAPERRYNIAHKATRSVVERCFGVLKSRFRCLDKTGGTMQLKVENIPKVIVACCVLHNMCVQARLPLEDDYDIGDEVDQDMPAMNDQPDGIRRRQQVILHNFT